MTSYRPVDSKREEFRKYLEKAGAMDALTKVLVMLYDEPEKPADALEYIRKHLGDSNRPDDAELNVLKSDLEESRLKIQTLEDEVKLLKERLAQYEPQENEGMEQEEAVEQVKSSEGEGAPAEGTASAEGTAPAEGTESAANASAAATAASNASAGAKVASSGSAAGSQPATQ